MKLLEIFSIIDEEKALLFELRNVVNNQDVKAWSNAYANAVATPFKGTDAFDQVYKWAAKALLKWMLENAEGHPVQLDPNGKTVDIGGTKRVLADFPEWTQQALQRGDELTWIAELSPTSQTNIRLVKNMRSVTDWLRYKYQTEPRTFTRLNRIPWHEAVRLAEEYHTELERKRPRDVNEMLDWFRENPDPFYAFLDEYLSKREEGVLVSTRDMMIRTLKTPGEYTWKSMSDSLGPRLWGKLRQHFKKASGFTVEMPKDDPSGRKPYLRYDDKGAILAPEPEKEEDPYLRMDWDDAQDQDALAGAEEVEAEDFEAAPEFGPGWYKLTTRKCVEYEGTLMGHCVGGYGREVEDDMVWIYSLRDAQNMPHVTIEVAPPAPGHDVVEIKQIKGRENKSPVAKYVPKVLDFIRNMRGGHQRVAWADEAEGDLLGMSLTVNEENEILMYDPPFESEQFNAEGYERSHGPGEDDDWEDEEDVDYEPVDEPLNREGTFVERGTFGEVLQVIAEVLGYDSWFAGEGSKYILEKLASGSTCWFSLDDPEDVLWVEVCYMGSDRGTKRSLKKVL